jgi:feruloyl esterase
MQLLSRPLVLVPALLALSEASPGSLRHRSDIVSNPAAACASLGESLAIENVTVNFATYLPAGTNISLSQDYDLATCGYTSQVVSTDTCRVAMYVATSNRSGITLEAWLPTNWTGRFLSTGNGGVSGCIQYADLAYTAGLGFATVGELSTTSPKF